MRSLAKTVAEVPQPPSYANFSIMLVNPAGGGVVLMHNPKNQLELVEASRTPQAFAVGYVPVRAIELEKLIGALRVVTSCGSLPELSETRRVI